MSELTDAWHQLNPGTDAMGGYVRLRLPGITACATYAARRIDSGLEALVLEASTTAIPALNEYPQSAGFEVLAEPLETGRSGKTRLLLALTHARFRDVFRSLCEDVTRSLSRASTESEAIRTFVSRLARWQAFLRKHQPDGLSVEERRGLFGELTFLLSLISYGLASIEAIRAWKGCKGANHDFQLVSTSFEIKSTAANTPHSMRISNVGQLDDRGTDGLFVVLISLDESESGSRSLPELVDLIRTDLGAAGAEEFEESLVHAGYLHLHEELYSSPRYTVRSRRYFHVADGFPRLVDTMLPAGIEDVKYSVAIAACHSFERDEQQVLEQTLSKTSGSR